MKEFVPAPLQRLSKQTPHGCVPKLRRAFMCASISQSHLWIMLEVNPGMTNYCERPALSVEQATGGHR
jgi:hypothetical protein